MSFWGFDFWHQEPGWDVEYDHPSIYSFWINKTLDSYLVVEFYEPLSKSETIELFQMPVWWTYV